MGDNHWAVLCCMNSLLHHNLADARWSWHRTTSEQAVSANYQCISASGCCMASLRQLNVCMQAQQLAVVQQLADSEFAVTSSSKQQSKRAKVERMSQVWDWLHGSNASAATNSAEANTAAEAQQGAHNTEQQKQPPKSMQAIQVAGD
eukprot:GHRR01019028.1.p1 GENE.GHRR01019028.1~~GHRR01019028.1.p1  ORF type:complete len:147 (+),score=60.54 GHRR01019028.1:1183-1623(+)